MRMSERKRNRQSCSRSKALRANDERGFTLIETSIALVVMMIVGLGAAMLFAYAIDYNSGAQDRALAMTIAQQSMERLRNAPFSDASIAATSASGTTTTVTNAGRSYSVTTTIVDSPSTSPTLKTITIAVTPQAAGASWVRTPVTIMAQRSLPSIGPYYQVN